MYMEVVNALTEITRITPFYEADGVAATNGIWKATCAEGYDNFL